MNKDQIWGLVRPILTAVLTGLAAKWFKDEATVQAIVAGVGALFFAIWAVVDKSQKGLPAYASILRHAVAIATGVVLAVIPDNKSALEWLGIIGTILAALSGGYFAEKKK